MFPAGRSTAFAGWSGCLLIAVAWATSAATASAQGRDGLFLTVPNPITSQDVQRLKLKVEAALDRQKRPIGTIVFDFNPEDRPAGTSDFGPCWSLASYIRDLRFGNVKAGWPRIKTFAFVHHETTRHTVLPVVSCDQIVMSDAVDPRTRKVQAKLGDVAPAGTALTETIRTEYRTAAGHSDAPDLVLRMLDPNLELRAVKVDGAATLYASPATIAELRKLGKAVQDLGVPPGLERGNALFEPDLAKKFGLVRGIFRTRQDLRAFLKLPPRSLAEAHLLDGPVVAWRIEVRGLLDAGKVQSIERHLNEAVNARANLIVFHLEAEAGDTQPMNSLANYVLDLKNQAGQPILTVAYVPAGRSLGAACYLALACTEIYMESGSVLADFDYLRNESAESLGVRRELLGTLAQRRGYPRPLFEAALSKDLVLHRVKDPADPAVYQVVTDKEFLADAARPQPRWQDHGRIDAGPEKFLKIDDDLARQFRIALEEVGRTPGLNPLYAHYGIDAGQVNVVRDDWLDRVAEFFREPGVKFVLLMLGILGLILELKLPGATVPGIIAAVCFVLFFWAHSFIGQFTLLASLLFVLGLILVGIEIFLIPGFGFTGVSGIVLMVGSLVLVTLERPPTTSADFAALGGTLTTFGLSVVAALVAAFVLAFYLPNIPYASRLMLRPPDEYGDEEGQEEGAPSPYAAYLGAIGVAATSLRPAGKVQFGDDFLDVVAEGDFLDPGTRVQVIEVEGNRVVVKQV